MLEKDVEQALVRRVKALGGLCEKFVSPGRRSVPDRIITLPGGEFLSSAKRRERFQASCRSPTTNAGDHWGVMCG
jgi:hypothetical protein